DPPVMVKPLLIVTAPALPLAIDNTPDESTFAPRSTLPPGTKLASNVTLLTGTVVFPICAPTVREPACEISDTLAFAFVLAASIGAVVCRIDALVATKLKSVPADDAPFIVTGPTAESDIRALVAAFAVTFATLVLNAFAVDVPPIPPAVEVNTKFVALTA